MRWLWVRHGETDINRQGRYLGHTDVSLHEHGIRQVKGLAEQLKSVIRQPVNLYTSDLQRCLQTAELLAEQVPCTVQAVPALRELSFGEWELCTYEELMTNDKERATRWYDDPLQYSPPQGESLRQLGERVDAWLMSREQAYRDEPRAHTQIIVTHGGVIRWFQAAWLEQDPSRFWQVEGLRHAEAMLTVWDGNRWTVQPHFLSRREANE
ncbi:histidine phosphatase family protein [Brevibacillus invocatus]|uniref:Histidine phosphatase family protein n=1 Tax=Brevibacillus invocatus TaxID=173959 RepID=A0A3M8BYQ6_9BACL|nr:histidine phosphatase family protein [Brevibacillus invocatus]RNB68493.1 histidine phosphatase family protein [Brevibacillus invocatus]